MIASRNFAVTLDSKQTKEADDEQVEKLSNAFKNQHIRYAPPKPFNFDVDTNEGRMTKVFESQSKLQSKKNRWKYSLGLSLTAIFGSSQTVLAAQLPFIIPAFAFPTLFFIW